MRHVAATPAPLSASTLSSSPASASASASALTSLSLSTDSEASASTLELDVECSSSASLLGSTLASANVSDTAIFSDRADSVDSSSPSASSDDDDDDDDDEETQLVFFGKPSAAEEEKRRQYEARMRRKKLIRRDSLDLARRRTIVFANGDDTDPEDETICLTTSRSFVDEQSETSPAASVCTGASSIPETASNASCESDSSLGDEQEMVRNPLPAAFPADEAADVTGIEAYESTDDDESHGQTTDSLLHDSTTGAESTLSPIDIAYSGNLPSPTDAEGIELELEQSDAAAQAGHAACLGDAGASLAKANVSVPLAEGADGVKAETDAVEDHHGRESVVSAVATDAQASTLQRSPGGKTELVSIDGPEVQDNPQSPGVIEATGASEDVAAVTEDETIGEVVLDLDEEATHTVGPVPDNVQPLDVRRGTGPLDTLPAEAPPAANQDCEHEPAGDLEVEDDEQELDDEEQPAAEALVQARPAAVEAAIAADAYGEQVEAVEADEGASETETEPEDESEERGSEAGENEVEQSDEQDSIAEGAASEGGEDADELKDSSIVSGSPADRPSPAALSGETSDAHAERRQSLSQPSDESTAFDACSLVEQQQAASSSSRLSSSTPLASSTPVRKPEATGAEAAILLSRGFAACAPSPVASLHSFSMDMSPGMGRALTLPPSNALRQSTMDDILGNLYESPRTGMVQGSYIECHGVQDPDQNQGRRRSAWLSQLPYQLPQPNRTPSLMKSSERKLLGGVTPASQQQQQQQEIKQPDAEPRKLYQSLPIEPEARSDAVGLAGDAVFESPSAEAAQKSRPRSRSQSTSPKKRRSKSKSPSKTRREGNNDDTSSSAQHSPNKRIASLTYLQQPAVASPSVRDVLNAWAGAKMVTPRSPEKRAAWLLPQTAVGLATPPLQLQQQQHQQQSHAAPQLMSWNLATSPDLLSSPERNIPAGSHPSVLRSPVKDAVGPQGQAVAAAPMAPEVFENPRTSAPLSEARSTLSAEATHHLEVQGHRHLQKSASTTQREVYSDAVHSSSQLETQPASATLHAPRIVRTLPSALTETIRPSRLIATAATGRQLGPRKVGTHLDLMADSAAAGGEVSTSSVSSASAARKPIGATVSALPRPVAAPVSRLPKPAASARTPAASTAVSALSMRSAPAATSRLASTKPAASTVTRSAAQPSAPRSTLVSRATNTATASAVPFAGSTRAKASAAAPASTATRGTVVGTADAAKKRTTVVRRVVLARSMAFAQRNAPLSASSATNRHGLQLSDAASDMPMEDVYGGAEAAAVAAEAAATGPTLSMLERSQQMQARALARTSPENGEASHASPELESSSLAPSAIDAHTAAAAAARLQSAASRGATSSTSGSTSSRALSSSASAAAGRVYSPVKAPGTAARLGLSSSSPIKHTAFLVPSSHLRRLQQTSSDSSSSSSQPPSRFGVPVSTSAALAASTPTVAAATTASTTPALRGRVAAATKSASANPFATSASMLPSPTSANTAAPVKVVRPRVVRATSLRSKPAVSDSVAETAAAQAHDAVSPPSLSEVEPHASSTHPATIATDVEPSSWKSRSVSSAGPTASSRISHAVAAGPGGSGSTSGGNFGLSNQSTSTNLVVQPLPISLLPLSATELTRLTNQHTRRNGVSVSKLIVKVERREGARPPSPSARLKESVSAAGRRKKREQEEREDEEGTEEEGAGMMERKRHPLGKGDEEVYMTPPRVAKVGKGVRWCKRLFAGPGGGTTEEDPYEVVGRFDDPSATAAAAARRAKRPRKSSLAPKEFKLDRFGNPDETILGPLSPRMRKTKVTIKKIVYDGEE